VVCHPDRQSLHYDDDETSAVEIVSNAEQLQEGFRKANLSGKGLRLNLSVGSAPVASAPSNPQLAQAKAATASSTTAASSPAAPAAAVASAANEVPVREAKQPLPPAVEYHVRNVPHDYPLAELSHLFAAFGTVEDVSLSPVRGTSALRTEYVYVHVVSALLLTSDHLLPGCGGAGHIGRHAATAHPTSWSRATLSQRRFGQGCAITRSRRG